MNFRLLTDDSTNIVTNSHIYVSRKHNAQSSLVLLIDFTVCNFHVATKCSAWTAFLKPSDSREVVTIRVTYRTFSSFQHAEHRNWICLRPPVINWDRSICPSNSVRQSIPLKFQWKFIFCEKF